MKDEERKASPHLRTILRCSSFVGYIIPWHCTKRLAICLVAVLCDSIGCTQKAFFACGSMVRFFLQVVFSPDRAKNDLLRVSNPASAYTLYYRALCSTATSPCLRPPYSNPIGFVNMGTDFSRGCAPKPPFALTRVYNQFRTALRGKIGWSQRRECAGLRRSHRFLCGALGGFAAQRPTSVYFSAVCGPKSPPARTLQPL